MTSSQCPSLVPPPVWLAAALAAQRLLGRRPPTALSRLVAAAVAGGSALVALSALAAMRDAGTTIAPDRPERASALVTDGPFRVTRNPIYLAMVGVLVAHAVYRRSALALLPAAGFVAAIDRIQIPAEERALESRFGRGFERYRRETPRWVPVPER